VSNNGNGTPGIDITSIAAKGKFLTFSDALRIEKVQVIAVEYGQGEGARNHRAVAWLDIGDALLLAALLRTGRFQEVLGGPFEAFGGSERDGQLESRIFRLEYDPGDKGQFAKLPWRATVVNGPGVRNDKGGVMPDPKADKSARTSVSVRMNEGQLLKALIVTEAYIRAHMTVNHQAIVAAKIEELRARMAERSSESSAGPKGNGKLPDTPEVRRALAAVLFFAPKGRENLKGMTLKEILDQQGDEGVAFVRWVAGLEPKTDKGKALQAAAATIAQHLPN